jgi:hypothetical protein
MVGACVGWRVSPALYPLTWRHNTSHRSRADYAIELTTHSTHYAGCPACDTPRLIIKYHVSLRRAGYASRIKRLPLPWRERSLPPYIVELYAEALCLAV